MSLISIVNTYSIRFIVSLKPYRFHKLIKQLVDLQIKRSSEYTYKSLKQENIKV